VKLAVARDRTGRLCCCGRQRWPSRGSAGSRSCSSTMRSSRWSTTYHPASYRSSSAGSRLWRAPGRTLAVAHEQVIGSGVIVDSAGFIITNARRGRRCPTRRGDRDAVPHARPVSDSRPAAGPPPRARHRTGSGDRRGGAEGRHDRTGGPPVRRFGPATRRPTRAHVSEARRDSRTPSPWAS